MIYQVSVTLLKTFSKISLAWHFNPITVIYRLRKQITRDRYIDCMSTVMIFDRLLRRTEWEVKVFLFFRLLGLWIKVSHFLGTIKVFFLLGKYGCSCFLTGIFVDSSWVVPILLQMTIFSKLPGVICTFPRCCFYISYSVLSFMSVFYLCRHKVSCGTHTSE